MPSRHTFFHPHCITFPPLTPLYPISPSTYHNVILSPIPALFQCTTKDHWNHPSDTVHQILTTSLPTHPIHPSNYIFSEIILPDALLENFLHYFFTTRIHLHLTLTVHCYRITPFHHSTILIGTILQTTP